jgi:ketosteroid isomerase-like protein
MSSSEAQDLARRLPSNDEEAIIHAVRSYPVAFQSGDVRTLLDLWDPRFGEHLTYISVEQPAPTRGVEALKAYYQALVDHYVVFDSPASDIRISVEGNLAYVTCDILWSWDSKSGGANVTIPARTSILLRKCGERWLFHHVHESITWEEPTPSK